MNIQFSLVEGAGSQALRSESGLRPCKHRAPTGDIAKKAG